MIQIHSKAQFTNAAVMVLRGIQEARQTAYATAAGSAIDGND